ncbi:MAG TPA: tetratricopeptide repeat protein [Clostridiaceae bacterium]|nr:tetratricopeptide repeat protein [Clostridiaceae bacterium]
MAKVIMTLLISSIIMATSGFSVYSMVAKPKFYENFLKLGVKYLQEGKYEEAILEFTKAIKIEKKSTQARVGAAMGYIGKNDIDKAVELLKEAQEIDIENENLLKQIINILKDIDPDSAYEMLMRYVDFVGRGSISSSIRRLLESADEPPQLPIVYPEPGAYIKPVSVKFESDEVRIGHAYYYTLDGSAPNRKSNRYKKPIKIEESTDINVIGYNPKGKTTEIGTFSFIIDHELGIKLENVLNESQQLIENTEVGTEPGNCIEGAKEEFTPFIEKANELMQQEIITCDDAERVYYDLSAALENFKRKIIVPTDRIALKDEIDRAKQLLDTAVEGTGLGEYREGAKAKLQEEIDLAIETYENLIARQNEIDEAKAKLTEAIDSFNAKKITEIDIIIANAGARTGPVTVSLLWNTTDDLDLHVTSPLGDTVYYGNQFSYSGGQLDVDRQVHTFVSYPIENIYWSEPPRGEYIVKVNVFTKRTSGDIPFQVRVVIDGEAKTYEMSINRGTVTVCTFTY